MKNHVTSDGMVVALDIGTTKICVLVAQRISDDSLNIIGIGKAPSYGVARGVIVDIAQAVYGIKLALKEAELMAGCKIESVYVGISGAHIQSINSHGMVPVKHGRVRHTDIGAVLTAAKAIVMAEGQQILHVLPQYYVIDGQQRVTDPIGMFGVRLEAQVHIVTGSVASVQNLISCCQMAGVAVANIILEPLASAAAVLSNDEKELGVGILDIGGGTSDFVIYQQGTIRYTKVFGIAGNHITHDIALCLRTTLKDAERIKCMFGSTEKLARDNGSKIEVQMVHGTESKFITVNDLIHVIEPRVTELFCLLHQEIQQAHLEHIMPAGIVLTGGGALLQAIQETGQKILTIPLRIGNPHIPAMFKEALESPLYATAYGLLAYTLKNSKRSSIENLSGSLVGRILWRMKSWVSDFF
jgi:cell division protein FtsA